MFFYDRLPSKYSFDRMAFTKLKSVYWQRTGEQFGDSDYASFGLVDEKGMLTNAGALLADESPIRHSRIFCTHWNGLDKASGVVDAIDDKEFSGGLINLLQEGTGFVLRNSSKAWKKTADSRIEMPDYPERAVMEGVVNALIHRDYLEIGSEVHIDMFDDRLEIYSPGGMYDGINVQDRDLTTVPSRRRNPVIADVFGRLRYMDRRGSGFKKIISDYQKQPQYTKAMDPEFRSDNGAFLLTLKNLNYKNELICGKKESADLDTTCINCNTDRKTDQKEKKTNQKTVQQIINSTQKTDQAIVSLLDHDPNFTIRELAGSLKLSESGIKYQIRKLKAEGRIQRIGPDKGGCWKVIKQENTDKM